MSVASRSIYGGDGRAFVPEALEAHGFMHPTPKSPKPQTPALTNPVGEGRVGGSVGDWGSCWGWGLQVSGLAFRLWIHCARVRGAGEFQELKLSPTWISRAVEVRGMEPEAQNLILLMKVPGPELEPGFWVSNVG